MSIFKQKRLWGLLITIGFLIYCFYDLDIYAILTAISSIDIRYLVPLLFLEVVISFVRASRLTFLIDAFKPVRLRVIFPIYCIGIMANLLMPYLTGQVARIYLFSKKARMKKAFIFTTTILELLFDGLALITIFLATYLFEVIPDDSHLWNIIALGCVVLFAISVLFVLSRSQNISYNFIHRFTGRLSPAAIGKIDEFRRSFHSGLEALKSSKHFSAVTLLSVLSWLLQASMVYLLILAFGFPISVWGAVTITAIVNIMMTIVVSPWNIGTFQGATVAAMLPFGVGKSEALAFSFLLHIFVYLPPVVLGTLFSFKEGLTFKELKDKSEEEADLIEKEKQSVKTADMLEIK